MARVEIKIEKVLGETILLRAEPIVQESRIIPPPSAKMDGQGARFKVEMVGPDVTRCEVGDYVILDPRGVPARFDPYDNLRVLLAEEDWVLAVCNYVEHEVEIATAEELAAALKAAPPAGTA